MLHTRDRKEGYLCASTNDSKLDYQQNNSAMEERKKTIFPLPIDVYACPRMSVRLFYFSLPCTQVGGTKRGKRVRENGCKIRVLLGLDVPNLCSPNSHTFSCLKVTLIRVNTRRRWPAKSPTIRSQKSNQNRKQINDYT